MGTKQKLSAQQIETQGFFDSFAESWRERSRGGEHQPTVPMERRAYVHHVARQIPTLKRFLDIGCGSGELVFEFVEKGVDSWGIDFAPQMIELCEQQKARCGNSSCHFIEGSVFDLENWTERFDLISALGLIEYLSPGELEDLADLVGKRLRPKGSFVVSSRNRLFNIYSSNDFTKQEIKAGTIESLVGEMVAIGTAESLDACIRRLRELEPPSEQIAEFPERADIEVTVRHQYTPAQLVQLIERHGFRVTALSPVNYHGLPPALKENWPDAHAAIKRGVIPRLTDCHRAIANASSFMVLATRSDGP